MKYQAGKAMIETTGEPGIFMVSGFGHGGPFKARVYSISVSPLVLYGRTSDILRWKKYAEVTEGLVLGHYPLFEDMDGNIKGVPNDFVRIAADDSCNPGE